MILFLGILVDLIIAPDKHEITFQLFVHFSPLYLSFKAKRTRKPLLLTVAEFYQLFIRNGLNESDEESLA